MNRILRFFKNLFIRTEQQKEPPTVSEPEPPVSAEDGNDGKEDKGQTETTEAKENTDEPSPSNTEKQMPDDNKPELARLDAAVTYNGRRVPTFAPNGFPTFADRLNELKPDSEEFAFSVGRIQREIGTDVDGFCGPSTIQKMAEWDREIRGIKSGIFIGPQCYELGRPVRVFADDDKLAGLSGRQRAEKITQLVLHYDVTFSSSSTVNVLRQRGLSYHFLIDGDEKATIFQLSNPTLNVAFHAGTVNNYSLGICLNNPAETKYQDQDAQRRGRRRGTKTDRIHGRLETLLDFFPEQIEAANEMGRLLCDVLGIRNRMPTTDDDKPLKKVVEDLSFEGIVGHYHVSESKIDPAPLNWDELKFVG